ncbi:MAG: helix-turn-helix transcriptional regulator [Bacteroidia bacterium]|nr:helix-turn-helix transcriptional regulator [Bacteroidia bacterium]
MSDQQDYLRRVGIRVRNRRMALKMSQSDLATRAEIAKRQLIRIEQGQVNTSILVLVRLANVFGSEVSELLGERPPRDMPFL